MTVSRFCKLNVKSYIPPIKIPFTDLDLFLELTKFRQQIGLGDTCVIFDDLYVHAGDGGGSLWGD